MNNTQGKSTVENIADVIAGKYGMTTGSTLTNAVAVILFNTQPLSYSGKSVDDIAKEITPEVIISGINWAVRMLQADSARIQKQTARSSR